MEPPTHALNIRSCDEDGARTLDLTPFWQIWRWKPLSVMCSHTHTLTHTHTHSLSLSHTLSLSLSLNLSFTHSPVELTAQDRCENVRHNHWQECSPQKWLHCPIKPALCRDNTATVYTKKVKTLTQPCTFVHITNSLYRLYHTLKISRWILPAGNQCHRSGRFLPLSLDGQGAPAYVKIRT